MKEIQLTTGNVAFVDDADYELLNQFNWFGRFNGHRTWYAYRYLPRDENGKQKKVAMHRAILGVTDKKFIVDHIDRDGLNNQRHNLRIATIGENNRNRESQVGSQSKYKGVSRMRDGWRATAQLHGKEIYMGCFKTEKEAAIVYNREIVKYHGEFAFLNKIDD